MFEEKIKKCIRSVQGISTSKMRQGREYMIQRKSTFSGRAMYWPKCKRIQCCIIRRAKYNDDLWEKKHIRQLKKLLLKGEKRKPGTKNQKQTKEEMKQQFYSCQLLIVAGGLLECKPFNVNLFDHFYFQAQLVEGYEVTPSATFWMSRGHGYLPLFVEP